MNEVCLRLFQDRLTLRPGGRGSRLAGRSLPAGWLWPQPPDASPSPGHRWTEETAPGLHSGPLPCLVLSLLTWGQCSQAVGLGHGLCGSVRAVPRCPRPTAGLGLPPSGSLE